MRNLLDIYTVVFTLAFWMAVGLGIYKLGKWARRKRRNP